MATALGDQAMAGRVPLAGADVDIVRAPRSIESLTVASDSQRWDARWIEAGDTASNRRAECRVVPSGTKISQIPRRVRHRPVVPHSEQCEPYRWMSIMRSPKLVLLGSWVRDGMSLGTWLNIVR